MEWKVEGGGRWKVEGGGGWWKGWVGRWKAQREEGQRKVGVMEGVEGGGGGRWRGWRWRVQGGGQGWKVEGTKEEEGGR